MNIRSIRTCVCVYVYMYRCSRTRLHLSDEPATDDSFRLLQVRSCLRHVLLAATIYRVFDECWLHCEQNSRISMRNLRSSRKITRKYREFPYFTRFYMWNAFRMRLYFACALRSLTSRRAGHIQRG